VELFAGPFPLKSVEKEALVFYILASR